jgi:alpha-glucosidase
MKFRFISAQARILPLGQVIEHTDELPGGPLELEIYPGKDATFTLVEDDGETTDYLQGQQRRTTFHWNDAPRELTWTTQGNYTGKDVFQTFQVTVFAPRAILHGKGILGGNGALSF